MLCSYCRKDAAALPGPAVTSLFRVDRLVAHGASGGQGFDSTGRVSRASTAVSVVALSSGDEVYMVIGQEGTSACNKLSRVSPAGG